MKVWAIQAPVDNNTDTKEAKELNNFLTVSLYNGISRFGWSSANNADLNILKLKNLSNINRVELEYWNKAKFLLNIKPGDWVVHINLPKKGYCIAAKVVGKYEFDEYETKCRDYKHILTIDISSLIKFDRNDAAILPKISSQLKLRGSSWMLSDTQSFLESIKNIKLNLAPRKRDSNDKILYLQKSVEPLFTAITEKINCYYPKDKLRFLIATVMEKIPNLFSVEIKYDGTFFLNNGEIYVTTQIINPVTGTIKKELLLVLINLYENELFETSIKNQIEEAIDIYKIDAVMIVDINNKTPNLKENLNQLSTEINKPINLLAGNDVTKFIVKHYPEIIFDN